MTEPLDGDAVEALEAVYRALPRIRCRRRCWDACGPIDMSPLERQRIIEFSGEHIPKGIVFSNNAVQKCPALSKTHRCKVYAVRPLICRIWGLTESMKCSEGCVPDGGYLSDEDAYGLLGRVAQIGGDTRYGSEEDMRRLVRDGSLARATEVVRARNKLGYIPGVRL